MKLPRFTLRDLFWLVLAGVALVMLNVPRDMKFGLIYDAGFPWTYATWEFGELTSYSVWAFTLNAAVAILFLVVLALLLSVGKKHSDRTASPSPCPPTRSAAEGTYD